MSRESLLNQLSHYKGINADEETSRKNIINFVHQYRQCFDRSLSCGHITGSCWLVNKDNSKALLMHHRKLDQWFQLGGHSDSNPNTLAVAIKEAQEESGINAIEPVTKNIFDVDVHFIPKIKDEQEHYHYDIRFFLRVTSDEQVVTNQEAKELRWIGKNEKELPTSSPSVVRMFHKWLDYKI